MQVIRNSQWLLSMVFDILMELLKIKSSDKHKILQECESLYYRKFLLMKTVEFTLQLEITRNLYLLSLFIQSTVSQPITACDFTESKQHLPYLCKVLTERGRALSDEQKSEVMQWQKPVPNQEQVPKREVGVWKIIKNSKIPNKNEGP